MRKLLIVALGVLPLWWGPARGRPWTVETIDSSGHAGQYSALAIDAAGGLHICYYDSLSQDLRYARYSSGAWSNGAIDTAGDVGRYCAITVGANNLPRVSYFDSTNRTLKYGVYNGTSWNVEVADPGPGVGQYTSIALDNTDHPSISYYDQANSNLKYAAKPASTWNRTTQDNSGTVGRFSSIAIGSGTKPRISYYSDDLKQLQYAYQKSGNWKFETPDPATNVGQYTSIVVNASDVVFVAYGDSANGRLKSATRNSNWSVDIADSSGFVGGFTSIALDNAGNPVISYYDQTHGDLEFAAYSGTAWSHEYVDTIGSVGVHSSCKVGPDSTIYIAYYDQTNGRLKLAHTVAPDTTPPGPPLNLTANGLNPSPWSNQPRFGISWVNPVDPSGISKGLYKIGASPTANDDTTGSLRGAPPDSVSVTVSGGQTLYLWLMDSLGNTRYQNNATVVLGYDSSVPTVAATYPDNGDTAAAINTSISATFSEPMDQAAMTVANFTVSGSISGVHSVAIGYSDADSTVTLNPAVDFSFHETVTVTVKKEVTDRAGNAMAADRIWSFLTGSQNDTMPPDPPQNLTANGSDPSPWSNNPRYGLTWTNPPDTSGIGRSLYKLGSAPSANDDTTGSLLGTPPDSVSATASGGQSMYLWLEDRSGNLRYQNNAMVTLRYDGTQPTGSIATSPPYSSTLTFTVNWTAGSDAGGSGLTNRYIVRVQDGLGPWSGWLANYNGFSASYTGVDRHHYYFEVGAIDSAGNVESFTAVAECSTLVDRTAPTVAATFPAAGDTAVAVNTSISATFTEPMDPAAMTAANFIVSGSASGSHALAISYNDADSTVTLNPTVDFLNYEAVTVTFKKELQDRAGNAMAADRVLIFSTGSQNDAVPPRIVHTIPDSAAVNVALNSWIGATFSEKLNSATVTSDKILIRGSINGVYPFWMSYGNTDSTLNLSAYSNFAAFESINVYIAPGIKDLAGNATTNTLWWWFRTSGVTDTIQPHVAAITLTPHTVQQADYTILTGRITDNISVAGAEYFIDDVGTDGSGAAVTPADSFGAAAVNVFDTISTSAMAAGSHRVYLHGMDNAGQWGPCDSAAFYKAAPYTEPSGTLLPENLVYVWPNPARGSQVHFHYYVRANSGITADVFTLEGRRIAHLTGPGEGGRPPNQNSSNAIVWDITGVASDVYLLRLSATSDAGGEKQSVTKKFAIVK